jgi:hypothetical protein
MLTGERLQVKQAEYSLLVQIYSKVKNHNTPHFTRDYLSTLGVSVSRADYLPSDGIEPSFSPAFFEPLSAQKLQSLLEGAPDDPEYPESLEFPTYGRPDAFDDVLSTTYGLDSYFTNLLMQQTNETEYTQLSEKSCWISKGFVLSAV